MDDKNVCAIIADMTTMAKNEIKAVIRTSIREVLESELMRFRVALLPSVSKKEQRDIIKQFGKPSGKYVRTMTL